MSADDDELAARQLCEMLTESEAERFAAALDRLLIGMTEDQIVGLNLDLEALTELAADDRWAR